LYPRSAADHRIGDTGDVNVPAPELPSATEWFRLGISDLSGLLGGKQSRVLSAVYDRQRMAVKLTDSRLADAGVLKTRMNAVETLADELPDVVAPMRIGGELLQPIGEWVMTATPLITGDRPDASDSDDVQLMGSTLARLHQALARLAYYDIPNVAALASDRLGSDRPEWQLLHGDFSDANLIATAAGLRIFDFDDCGYGPVEYDLANSLYMVLFGSDVNGHAARYDTFRPAFLDGYSLGSGQLVDSEAVDEMITKRIQALGRWLNDLSNAPIGIRTASPEWHETLRSFVARHGQAGHE